MVLRIHIFIVLLNFGHYGSGVHSKKLLVRLHSLLLLVSFHIGPKVAWLILVVILLKLFQPELRKAFQALTGDPCFPILASVFYSLFLLDLPLFASLQTNFETAYLFHG